MTIWLLHPYDNIHDNIHDNTHGRLGDIHDIHWCCAHSRHYVAGVITV